MCCDAPLHAVRILPDGVLTKLRVERLRVYRDLAFACRIRYSQHTTARRPHQASQRAQLLTSGGALPVCIVEATRAQVTAAPS
jgi:hypothetical protein